jgi:hypothetical protein
VTGYLVLCAALTLAGLALDHPEAIGGAIPEARASYYRWRRQRLEKERSR